MITVTVENSVQSLESFIKDLNDPAPTDEQPVKGLALTHQFVETEAEPLPCALEISVRNDEEDPEIDELVQEINQVAAELYELLKDHPHWCNKFLIIHQLAPEVIAWAKDYDYNGVRANGYWTLIRLAIKLARLVVEKYRGVRNPVVDQNLELLLDYSLIAVDVLKVLRKDSVENPNPTDGSLNLVTSHNRLFIELFGLLLSLDDKMVASMYGRYCGFWLCNQSRLTAIMFVTALAIGSRGINTDVPQCIYNPEYRGLVIAKLIKSADISFVKMMGSLMEWRIYKHVLPSLLYWRHSLKISEFHVKHQRTWFLSACNVKVMRFEKNGSGGLQANIGSPIRCRLYQNMSAPLNDKLIVLMHGGGFIIGTPESHDVYVQNWCSQLPGCSILSVDYSVSPEAKFPVALQQLLDVYLFVAGGSAELIETIGFRPNELILAGDSAGGNLTMAVLLVLNDINRQIKHLNDDANNNRRAGGSTHLQPIKMPKSILNLYGVYNLTLNITPSIILASCDSMISAGVMLSCFEAYLPLVNLNAPEPEPTPAMAVTAEPAVTTATESRFSLAGLTRSLSSLLSSSTVKEPSTFDQAKGDGPDNGDWLELNGIYTQMMELIQGLIGNIKSLVTPKVKPKPWYLADKKALRRKLDALDQITVNPYISPLLYEHFEDLQTVDLYLIGLHYDPFLDDNVTMAKKWKGKVTFDVLDGLQHGFLNFMPFVDEAKKANQVCIERLKQAIYC